MKVGYLLRLETHVNSTHSVNSACCSGGNSSATHILGEFSQHRRCPHLMPHALGRLAPCVCVRLSQDCVPRQAFSTDFLPCLHACAHAADSRGVSIGHTLGPGRRYLVRGIISFSAISSVWLLKDRTAKTHAVLKVSRLSPPPPSTLSICFFVSATKCDR